MLLFNPQLSFKNAQYCGFKWNSGLNKPRIWYIVMNKIVVAQRLVSSSLVLLITRERSSKELMSSKLRVHLCHKRPGWGNIQIIGLIQIDPFQGHIKLTSKTLKLLLVDDMGEYETDRLLTLFFDEFILLGVIITYLVPHFKYSSLHR